MSRRRGYGLIDYLRRLAGGAADAAPADRQLLERFVRERDEEAFHLLMQRHGPLVWGVCRRVLEREADVEDAFQAVFLVLARRAASVCWQADIGNWLYGVAHRVAHKARSRRQREEARMRPPCEVVAPPSEENEWIEVRSILDDEIQRLPEKYRTVVVLCYLQGKTYREAAQVLNCPEGTVSGRLARAREMLRGSLTRRGLAPSAVLLTVVPTQSADAVPPTLVRVLVQAAPRFMRRQTIPEGLISQTVLTLVNEAMRTMMHLKGTIVAFVLLALGTAGATALLWTQHEKSEAPQDTAPAKVAAPRDDTFRRPPLKKEWQGRWQSNPFADTVALEVEYGGKKYKIENVRKVAALIEQLSIRSFHNGMARDFLPSAILLFHKKDGTQASVWLGEGPFFSGLGGEMVVDPAFLVALGREWCDDKGKALDLLHRPAQSSVKKLPPLTLASLANGFELFAVTYFRGARLRTANITDRKMLDQLASALTAINEKRDKAPKESPPQQVHFIPKGGTGLDRQYGSILDREHVVLGNFGRLTVKPSFVETLNKQLSQLEGRTVDVLGKNQPPQEQLRREQELLEALRSARRLRIRREDGSEIVVGGPAEVKQLAENLKWVETPVRREPLERARRYSLEVTTAKDTLLRLTPFDTGLGDEKVSVAPLDGKLWDISGYGPLWLDRRFQNEIQLYGERCQDQDRERRSQETFRLVCQDLPAFLKQIFNVVVWYRQGEDDLIQCLTAEESQPLLEILRRAKVEKVSWTKKHWDEEIKRLEESHAATLELTPGMGFSMIGYINGEKELLLPDYGRLHLPTSIVAPLRRAVESNAEKAATIQVLPR